MLDTSAPAGSGLSSFFYCLGDSFCG